MTEDERKKLNGRNAHLGAGLGAVLALVLVNLGRKIDVELTTGQAGLIVAGAIAVCGWLARIISDAWTGPGLWPAIKRGFIGSK